MEPFLLTTLIASLFFHSAASRENQCGCVDRSWCDKRDPTKKLDCPLSYSLCTAIPLSGDESKRLDKAVASVSTDCENGWSVASLKATKYGFPNPMVAIVQNNLTDGNEHTMFIDGYNGKYPARFIFKSKDDEGNIPLFMTMFLWEEYIAINGRKDWQWCSEDIRVDRRVGSEFWYMTLKVRMANENQQVDIFYFFDDFRAIYRFYPQTHIKRGDWFIFYEDYYYILGIAWSRIRHVQFKTSPIPGSRITIRGEFSYDKMFDVFINDQNGRTKMTITGVLGYTAESIYHYGTNEVRGYSRTLQCSYSYFIRGRKATITIEVTAKGIKLYGYGWHLCTFESDQFNSDDISQIDVNGALKVLGYAANTCDYYRY